MWFRSSGERIAAIWATALVLIVFLSTNPLMPGRPSLRWNTGSGVVRPTGEPGQMPAKSVQEFRSGVCVNVHWYFGSTPYTVSYSSMKSAIQDLGITCLRDQWNPASSTQKTRFVDLADESPAIKHSVIIDRRRFDDEAADRTAADTDLSGSVSTAEAIDHLLDNAPGSVLSLEGPNELLATDCADAITTIQEIWAVKQTDPRLADIPILSPSAAQSTEYSCLGDISAYTDEGNIHSYPGDSNPEAADRGANASLTGWINNVSGAVGSGVPITATETGYHTAINYTGGHEPVTETADGKYMAQMYFSYQRRGVHRVFKYELVNEHSNPALDDAQDHFGYLRNDLTEKPSYQSVDNMMDILADTGTMPALTPLDYQLSSATGTVKSYLLQHSDGSHWLAVWNDVNIYDPTTEVDLTPSDVTATLSLTAIKSLNIYRPYVSASVQESVATSSKVLSVNADPLLVRIQADAGSYNDGYGDGY